MASEQIDSDNKAVSADVDLLHTSGKVDPVLALELRLRWLEALILGMKQDISKDRKGKAREEYAGMAAVAPFKAGDTLTRLAETVQNKLDKTVEDNEGLKRFMDHCAFLRVTQEAWTDICSRRPECAPLDAILCPSWSLT